jgi:hypothetical protein
MNHLLTVLRETWEGPERLPCYLDRNAGLRDTLGTLSAAEASRGEGRTTIAAHAFHILFGLEAFGAPVRGDDSRRDWNESWRVSKVTDEEWRKLQADVAREYEAFFDAVQNAKDEAALLHANVGIAHLVYHLGAIRSRL